METTKTQCDRCQGSIERGYNGRFKAGNKGSEPDEVICFACDKVERWDKYKQDERLGTRLLMDATMAALDMDYSMRVVFEKTIRLGVLVKRFHARVWLARGLYKYLNESKWSGHSGKAGSIKILTWCCAGRAVLTMEDEDCSLTLITEDKNTPTEGMGIQGIDGTEDQVSALILRAIERWPEAPLGRDDEVSMI